MLQVYFRCFSTPLCVHHQLHIRYPTDNSIFCHVLANISTVTVLIASIIQCCKSLMSLWWLSSILASKVLLCLDVGLCLYKLGNKLVIFLQSVHFHELYFSY